MKKLNESKYGMAKKDIYRLAKYAIAQKDDGHASLYAKLMKCAEEAGKRLVG